MKIKLAILENDQSYLSRIVSVFSTKYSDKFQVYSFTDYDMALSAVSTQQIEVLIANTAFDVNTEKLPKKCAFAYFVDSTDIDTVKGQVAICKFQKAELIYKQILSIYSEKADSITGIKMSGGECRLTVFSSPCGGCGTSSIAAAYALYLAHSGKKVLFLSYEDFGEPDTFFSGEGQFDMSDVVFAVKSKKANLAIKLESYVKQDNRGVCFFSKAKFSLDMLELSHDERIQLISELHKSGSYEDIVLDLGSFGLDKEHMDFYKKAQNIVMVSCGTEISNAKTVNAYTALVTLSRGMDVPVANRFSLLYNRVSSKTGKMIEGIDLPSIGGSPVYSNATVAQVIEQLSVSDFFAKLN